MAFGKKKMAAAAPPKPPQTESGSVEAIGMGESQTNLNFRPKIVTYEIIEELPGTPSCNPAVKPTVKISQFQTPTKHWALKFEWKNLTGVNFINWFVSE